MKKVPIHAMCYTFVAAAAFWGGMWTRDYLAVKKRAEASQRPARYLDHTAPEVRSFDIQGKSWSLADQRGKVVFLDFWSTRCAPCIAGLPELQAIASRFSQRADFALYGIALDSDGETVLSFCKKRNLNWTQLFEPGREFDNLVARAFEVRRIPCVCVIDKKGVVRYYDGTSSRSDAGGLQLLISKLLSEE
jgi:peroxiredoxin